MENTMLLKRKFKTNRKDKKMPMKNAVVALTTMTTAAIAESSLIEGESNPFPSQQMVRQVDVTDYLNNLNVKEVSNSETLKTYINNKRPAHEREWAEGFVKADGTWVKGK